MSVQLPNSCGSAKSQDNAQPARPAPRKGRVPILVILVLLLATALRTYNLDGASLWSDETRSALMALTQPLHIINNAGTDVHSPAFYLVEHYWIKGLGQSDYSIRLLSVFSSVLTVAVTFALSKRIFRADTATVAAVLVAASEFHLRLAQEARPYALLSLLTVTSFLFLAELVRRPAGQTAGKYVLVTIPLIYIHPYGLIVVAAQNLFMFLQWRPKLSFSGWPARWISIQFALLLAYSPWLAQFAIQLSRVRNGVLPYYALPTASSVLGTFLEFANLSRYLLGIMILLSIVAFGGIRTYKYQSLHAMLSIWLVAPAAIAFLVSWIFTPIYDTRGLIGSSPALYILAAHGLCKLHSRYFQAGLLVIMLGFCGEALWYYYPNVHKDDWRGAAGIIAAQAHQGDTLCVVEYYDDALRFYLTRTDLIVGCKDILEPLAQSGKLPALPDRFWFLHQNNAALNSNPREQLGPQYFISKFDLTGLQLSLFERKQ